MSLTEYLPPVQSLLNLEPEEIALSLAKFIYNCEQDKKCKDELKLSYCTSSSVLGSYSKNDLDAVAKVITEA